MSSEPEAQITPAASKAQQIKLSIVMPAYNEAARIGPTLREYVEHFRPAYGDAFEVVTVLNGCTDATRDVIEEVARAAPQVRIVEFAQPLGKGGAIWEGLALAEGDQVAYVDADNMVRAPEAEKLIRALETHDLAIADRFSGTEEGGAGHSGLRKLISAGSRLWSRVFLRLPYSDTQCGAKAFRSSVWRMLAPRVFERGWAFDLEVLVQAKSMDLRVAEIPVRWRHVAEGSKIRPWKDVPLTLWATLRIRRRKSRG